MVTFLCRLFVWSVQKKSLFCHSHSEKYSNIDTLSSASCAPDCCNVLCSAGAPHVLSISFSEKKNAFSAQLNANVAVWTWHKIKLSSYCSLDRILRPNRPFYSCGLGILAFAGTWGWGWGVMKIMKKKKKNLYKFIPLRVAPSDAKSCLLSMGALSKKNILVSIRKTWFT